MPSSFTTNNGFEKPATGEQNNTWGGTANTDFDLIDTALDGVVTLSLTGTTHALAITDGAASDGRNRILLCTGALAANNTITLSPNDAEKWFFVYNGTTGGFSVIFAQGGGSGSTVTIANGYWAIIRCDGTGTNANVTRVLDSLEIGGTLKAAVLAGSDGSAATPLYSFSADTNTGLYRIGADQIGVSTGGVLRETTSTTAITSTLPLLGAAGSAAAPQYSFSGDTNTGLLNPSADTIGFSVNGTQTAYIDATFGLSANGAIRSTSGTIDGRIQAGAAAAFAVGTFSNHSVLFYSNNSEKMRLDTNGRLGIGTASIATSAALEISSTTGALLLPRLTTAERDALTAVDGMVIYNTTTGTFQGRAGGAWVNL